MRVDPQGQAEVSPEVRVIAPEGAASAQPAAVAAAASASEEETTDESDRTVLSLARACSNGDISTVRQLLAEGRSVHETTEEGESLLSLACSAGYFELAQVGLGSSC
jgi:ankyrin repeat domain-containing protein 17